MRFGWLRSSCAARCFATGSSSLSVLETGSFSMPRLSKLLVLAVLPIVTTLSTPTAPSAQARDAVWTQLPWNERIGLGWYRQLAEQGEAEAQYRLGLLHQAGVSDGAERDTARDWYQAAADQGHVQAQFALARLLQSEDPATAAGWYRAAAEQGSAGAAFNLAVILENGQGVPADQHEAARLYELAFARGIGQAALNRGTLEMRKPEPDRVVALAWVLRARQAAVSSAGQAEELLAKGLTQAERAEARRLADMDAKGGLP